MRFLRTASTTRLLAAISAVLVAVSAGAAIAVAAVGSGPVARPAPLADAVHTALAAPRVTGVSADITFTDNLIDSTDFTGQATDPLLQGASGRLWIAPGRLRIELQAGDGDAQIIVDHRSWFISDPAQNVVYEGTLPAGETVMTHAHAIPTVAQISRAITRLMGAVNLSGAQPTDVAGQAAYRVTISPRGGGGLVGSVGLAFDAVRGVPLAFDVYARGDATPVLGLTATDISYGVVSPSDFAVSPPTGAKIIDLGAPHATAVAHAGPQAPVSGVAAVSARLPFTVSAPARLAGRSRHAVRLLGSDSALIAYGAGLGAIAVIESPAGSSTRDPASTPAGGLSLPTRSVDGASATVLTTPLGTVLHVTRGGVSDTVLGSMTGPGGAGGGPRTVNGAAPPIEVRGLVKRYGDITAVAGVDITVNAGDVYGYLGPNGAGKTTSLRMMLGLIRPSEGTVRLFGRDPVVSARALEGVAGFVEAPTFYPYLTARRNLELLAAYDGDHASARIDASLATVELTHRAGDKVGGFSHGMRQRMGIAAALLRDPRLLLLDEPATGLDPGGMRDMRRLVRRLADAGMTVLLSSHLLGEVEELCNRVAIVRAGTIVYEGEIAALKRGSAGTLYRLRTSDDVRARTVCEAQPGVSAVRTVRGAIEFSAEEGAVGPLSAQLIGAGALIDELAPQTVTLEDLFFSLTEPGDPADPSRPAAAVPGEDPARPALSRSR